MKWTKYITLTLALVFSLLVQATEIPPAPPKSEGLVWDTYGVLTSQQEAALEQYLLAYEDTTSTQIFVYIVGSIDDDYNLYAAELAEEWGIGQKGVDNGCIMLIGIDDRFMAIQNGYGLEPYLTDLQTGRIIQNDITPYFKAGQYFEGISNGVIQITKALNGTYEGSGTEPDKKGSPKFVALIILAIFILFISSRNGRGGGGRRHHGGFWIGGMGHGFGGGGSSGFGGGGFGGFGGGGFGGGGASGGW